MAGDKMPMMDSKAQPADAASATGSWWKPLDRYQKEVFVLASLAWLFDCLGQQVFVIARNPALWRRSCRREPRRTSSRNGAVT
jgi:hypothetical protein